jgi:chromosome segregation ATPase
MSTTTNEVNSYKPSITVGQMVKFGSNRDNGKQLIVFRKSKPQDENDFFLAEIVAQDFVIAATQMKVGDELVSLRSKINGNGNMIDQNTNRIQSIESNVNEIQDSVQKLRDEDFVIAATQMKVGDELVSLRSKINGNGNMIGSNTKRIQSIEYNVNGIQDSVQRLRNEISNPADVNAIRSLVDSMEKEVASLVVRTQEMGNNASHIAKSLAAHQCEYKEELSQRDKRIKELEERMDEQQRRFDEFRELTTKSLQHSRHEYAAYDQQMSGMREDISKNLVSIERLWETVSKNTESIEQLWEKVKGNEVSVLSDLRKETESLRSHVNREVEDVRFTLETVRDKTDTCAKTMETKLSPGIVGLATDIRNLQDNYNKDIIRVERDCTNRVDALAADIVHDIKEVKSGVLDSHKDLKSIIDKLNLDFTEMKRIVEDDSTIIVCK